jgi:hypothetical protein
MWMALKQRWLSVDTLTLCGVVHLMSGILTGVTLCECETWSLTLREENRLRVFENKVVSRIFGPKRDEVTV